MPRRPVERDRRNTGRRVTATRAALGALLVVAMLTACSAGPSRRPAVALTNAQSSSTPSASSSAAPKPVPPLDKPSDPEVDWTDCDSDTRQQLGAPAPPATLKFQCAQVSDALDPPSAPGRGLMRLALLKAGNGPVPLVVVNDVDGEAGTLYAARLAATLPPALLRTFSLVGIDRRGTGNSEGAHCVPDDARSRMLDYDPASTEVNELLDAARDASQQCVLELDVRLGALDTWRTSADLDAVRTALGVAHLNAIGHGEGSRVLTVYADRYPEQVGRFVLDGAPDPTVDVSGQAEAKAAGAQAAFQAFATDCLARHCALGANPAQVLSHLLGTLRTSPSTNADGDTLTVGAATAAVLAGLGDRASWPALSDAIGKANSGDPGPLRAFAAPLVDGADGEPPLIDARIVTGCNDDMTRLPPEQISGSVKDWSSRYPLFGGAFAQGLVLCSPWPVPDQPLPKPGTSAAPPMVVVSTAADPVTPQAGSERTAQELAGSALVGWQGAGHGALGTSTCATSAAQTFLVGGRLPHDGMVCPP